MARLNRELEQAAAESPDAPPPFDAAPEPVIDLPRELRRIEFFPDGERFLMVAPVDVQEEEEWFEVSVTLNFFEELNARAPTRPPG